MQSFVGLVFFALFELSLPKALGASLQDSCPNGQCEGSSQNVDASILIQHQVQTILSGEALSEQSITPKARELLRLVEEMGKHNGEAVSRQSFTPKAQELLNLVEDMEKEAPGQNVGQIEVIKNLVNNVVLPDLVSTHNHAREYIVSTHATIDACNQNAYQVLSNITQTDQATVSQARQDHVACRTAEGTAKANMQSKCSRLLGLLQDIREPATLSSTENTQASGDRVTRQVVVETGDRQKTPTPSPSPTPYGGGELSGSSPSPTPGGTDNHYMECEQASNAHTAKRTECNTKQAHFEQYFCTWRAGLTDACSSLSTCYEAAVKSYTETVASTEALVAKWKTEYTALNKILCHVEVWMPDPNPHMLQACKAMVVDTTPMDITYPPSSAQQDCSLAAVENYPGTTGFLSEYQAVTQPVQQVVACLVDGAPAPAPPTPPPKTATPTPSPVATPTPSPSR